jgi:hypothetical protein
MAQSIPGGAFKDASGAWHDANGKPLDKKAQAQAEQLYAEQATQRAEADRMQLMADAQRDPVARALLTQQQLQAEKKATA